MPVTSTALVARRDYLDGQRRLIIARAVAGSLAGALPVPFLDDWALERVLGAGYRRIAAAHGVDVDDDAMKALVHGRSAPPSVVDLAAAGVASRVAGRAASRMMIALAAVNRARKAAHHFVVMTLFDHYCAKLHVGLGLDGATALALREEISRAIDATPGALAFHPFRRGIVAAARATLRAPLELADLASRGRLRKLLAKTSEVTEAEAVDEMDRAVEMALANKNGFLGRTVAAVEVQLSAEVNPFLESALDNLDRRWRARIAAQAPQDPKPTP
ncbi:MAG: hypothetical protein KF773_14220 [Deltaproteobacteria bacterium]|nr:hypothetical protein [Deltaproteobacteria bacterium]